MARSEGGKKTGSKLLESWEKPAPLHCMAHPDVGCRLWVGVCYSVHHSAALDAGVLRKEKQIKLALWILRCCELDWAPSRVSPWKRCAAAAVQSV